MYKGIKAEVLDVRHSYKVPSMELPLESSQTFQPKEAFAVKASQCSMKDKVGKIAGYVAQAPFFSPKAINNDVPAADLYVLSKIYKQKDPLLVTDFHFHSFCAMRHHVAWRFTGTSVWYCTMMDFPGSSMVVCPLVLNTRLGPAWHYFVHQKLAKVERRTILDPRKVEAVCFTWRSPSWLHSV